MNPKGAFCSAAGTVRMPDPRKIALAMISCMGRLGNLIAASGSHSCPVAGFVPVNIVCSASMPT